MKLRGRLALVVLTTTVPLICGAALAMNAIAIYFRYRFRKRISW